MKRRTGMMPSVPVVARDPGGIKRDMPDEEPDIDMAPPIFPPPKPFDIEDAIRRDAASPWKKEWHGNGEPTEPENLPTYEEWKARKDAEKRRP
jgi:hypothetical protein